VHRPIVVGNGFVFAGLVETHEGRSQTAFLIDDWDPPLLGLL
jgi:hypothetical protein